MMCEVDETDAVAEPQGATPREGSVNAKAVFGTIIAVVVAVVSYNIGRSGVLSRELTLTLNVPSVVHIGSAFTILVIGVVSLLQIVCHYQENQLRVRDDTIDAWYLPPLWLTSMVGLALHITGGAIAIAFASAIQWHLFGVILIYGSFCMVSTLTMAVYRQDAYSRLEERDAVAEDPGLAYLSATKKWLYESDAPSYVGLCVLFFSLLYVYPSLSATKSATSVYHDIEMMATGAAAFHIILSQLHFLFAYRALVLRGEFE